MVGKNGVVEKSKTKVKNTKVNSVWEKQTRENKKQGMEAIELSL